MGWVRFLDFDYKKNIYIEKRRRDFLFQFLSLHGPRAMEN